MDAVGFGKTSLRGTWPTTWSFADDIEARAVVWRPEHGDPVAIVIGDLLSQWPSRCLPIREAVARRIQTPPENVGVFCTQNHGVPLDAPDVFELDRLAEAFARAAGNALNTARPALMAYVETSPRPAGVINRRVRVDGAGSFTFYFGFDVFPNGRAGHAHLLDLAIRGLYAGSDDILRCPHPQAGTWPAAPDDIPGLPPDPYFSEAEDPLMQGLFFKTPDGRPLGSISRWAAHPITANAAGSTSHSADYPYYVRQCLAREFGGGAAFLTGPCGNQAPLVHRKSVALAQQTGEWVARQLLSALPAAQWRPLEAVGAASEWIELPVRSDYPRSLEQAQRDREAAQAEFHAWRTRKGPERFRRLKALADEMDRLNYTCSQTHRAWCGLTVADLAAGRVRHPIFALRANDTVIAGLPGEPFGAFSVALRAHRSDVSVITAEECNGYLGYIPTAAEFPLGGYESDAAIFHPDAEAILLRESAALMARGPIHHCGR